MTVGEKSYTDDLVACAWSGGKDSCLALHRAAVASKPIILISMLTEDGMRSRSNGVSLPVLQAQADSLGIQLLASPTSWTNYEQRFKEALVQAHSYGARGVVFGDLRGSDRRKWNEKVCKLTHLKPKHPLWGTTSESLLDEIEHSGYRARICAVKADRLAVNYVGRNVNKVLGDELRVLGIDPAGENGEYHTVVLSAPLFRELVEAEFTPPELHNGYWHVSQSLKS